MLLVPRVLVMGNKYDEADKEEDTTFWRRALRRACGLVIRPAPQLACVDSAVTRKKKYPPKWVKE